MLGYVLYLTYIIPYYGGGVLQLFLSSQTIGLRDPEVKTQGNRGVGFEVLIEFGKATISVFLRQLSRVVLRSLHFYYTFTSISNIFKPYFYFYLFRKMLRQFICFT